MSVIDMLKEIKQKADADRVRIEVGEYEEGFEIELCVFRGDRVYPFFVDEWESEQPVINYVMRTIERAESEPFHQPASK